MSPRVLGVVVAALAVLLCEIQATVFACYTWAALMAARLLIARPPIAELARAIGGFAVRLVAGGLLAAVALLPGLELARESVRHTSTLSIGAMYPFGLPPPRGVWSLWFATGSQVLLLAALGLVTLRAPTVAARRATGGR